MTLGDSWRKDVDASILSVLDYTPEGRICDVVVTLGAETIPVCDTSGACGRNDVKFILKGLRSFARISHVVVRPGCRATSDHVNVNFRRRRDLYFDARSPRHLCHWSCGKGDVPAAVTVGPAVGFAGARYHVLVQAVDAKLLRTTVKLLRAVGERARNRPW